MSRFKDFFLDKESSWVDFEELCCDVLNTIYKNEDEPISFDIFDKYGRRGQKQHGIDIISSDYKIAAQCKNFNPYKKDAYKELIKEIDEDFKEATEHFKEMTTYIVMTSLNNDTHTQDKIHELSKVTGVEIKCYFWDKIIKIVLEDKELMKQYYGFNIDDESIPKKLLDIIFCVNMIEHYIMHFHNNMSVSNIYSDWEYWYNCCVKIHSYLRDLWGHIRINKLVGIVVEIDILDDIKDLTQSTPELAYADFNVENVAEVYTITDFRDFCSDEQKYSEYITTCNNICEKIRSYYNKEKE